MSWSARFSEPISVPGGRKLATLADARAYVLKLDQDIRGTNIWETAIRNMLCAAADGSGPWVEFARATIELAIANPSLLNDRPVKPNGIGRTRPEKTKRR